MPRARCPATPASRANIPEQGAVRIVRELTGLDVVITAEFITFIQHGTPTGTMCAHGYTARVVGGCLLDDGPEGRLVPTRWMRCRRSCQSGWPTSASSTPTSNRAPPTVPIDDPRSVTATTATATSRVSMRVCTHSGDVEPRHHGEPSAEAELCSAEYLRWGLQRKSQSATARRIRQDRGHDR